MSVDRGSPAPDILDEIHELVGPAVGSPNGVRRDLPVINCGRQLRDVSQDALDALRAANDPPRVFARSGALARVRRDEEGRPIIDTLGKDEACNRLAQVATWIRLKETQGRRLGLLLL